jgi:four helix bundle protein
MQDFRNLKVWEKAHQLTLAVYRASAGYPSEERFGLTSQTRRATVSIPTNIAEGCGRGSDPDFARFLQISMGSAAELDYLLLLAFDLGMLKKPDHVTLSSELSGLKRMPNTLLQKVKSGG